MSAENNVTTGPQITHAEVLAQYDAQFASDPHASPEFRKIVANLASSEARTADALIVDAVQHESTRSVRPEYVITPAHHMDHILSAEAVVPDIRERTAGEQDFIGMTLEIGDEAIFGEELSEQVSEVLTALSELARQAEAPYSEKYKTTQADMNAQLGKLDWSALFLTEKSKLLHSAIRFEEVLAEHDPHAESEETTLPIRMLLEFTDEQLREIFEDEESTIRDYLMSAPLHVTQRAWDLGELIRRASSTEDMIYAEPGDEPLLDKVRAELGPNMYRVLTMPEVPTDTDNMEAMDRYEQEMRQSIKELLKNGLGLSDVMARNMGKAMSNRLHKRYNTSTEECEISAHYNRAETQAAFGGLIVATQNQTPAELERLHNELGVVNLDMYEVGDLECLLDLLDGNQEMAEHYKSGDTKVIFTDAYGDYNGALTEVFRNYRNRDERTILFEVSQPSDIYRRMIMLKKLGIKPSTLVVAAHGEPGLTVFGGKEKPFNLVTTGYVGQVKDGDNNLELDRARLDRLTSDEFMQDSRGIDDALEQMGRRTFILHSCSSDAAFNDLLPSTAETIVTKIDKDTADVYAAGSDMYAQASDGKVRFTGKVDDEFIPNGNKLTREIESGRWSQLKQWRLRRQQRHLYGYNPVKHGYKVKRTEFAHIDVDNREEVTYL